MLNKQQYNASRPDKGVSLILAGAGTGKTKTLVEKVQNILQYTDINPEEIVLLTFSRKAAEEIKSRIRPVIKSDTDKIFAGTFHSFCYYLIKKNQQQFFKVSDYSKLPEIFTEEKKLLFFDRIVSENLKDFYGFPKDIIFKYVENPNKISLIRNDELRNNIFNLINQIKEYKISKNYIEFEELILYTNKMFNDKVFKKNVSDKIKYIFVDEFQDTSDNNFELLFNILGKEKNIFMVGDDFQSIYKFRSANVNYIINIRKFFPETITYKLSTNYRSKEEIVNLSNTFIKNNKKQTKKKLYSHKGKGGTIKAYSYLERKDQVKLIENILIKYSDESTAVIYRNNNFFHNIENNYPHLLNYENIQFMTIHASKGLEFNTVIIADIDDKIIPSPSGDLEEERRLFYVAITRAEKNLFFLYNNSGKTAPRFINELKLPKKYFNKE